MICQSTYDNLEAVPENLRDEFHQVNGKWVLKDSAIPGVGALFNAALAKNSERQLGQLATARQRITDLEGELNTTQDRLSVLDTPGTRTLSKEDSAAFDEYVKFGTPADLKKKLVETDTLREKVTKFETSESLTQLVAANGSINAEVLSDWATSKEGEGLTFFVKSVEQDNGKGKVMVDVPFVKIEKLVDGKTQVSEKELLPFAKESLPEWKYAALTTVAGERKEEPRKQPGVRVPNLGSVSKAPAGGEKDKERPVDKFNKQRGEKANPFTRPSIPGMVPVTAGIK